MALKRMFDAAAMGKHDFTALQNYELIGSGTPFPFDTLTSYDAVAYSPIRNKGDWNTSILQARCDELGVKTVSFPWLQWNGYFPDVGDAPAPHRWTYQRLACLAGNGATLDELRQVALDPDGFDALNYLEYAFRALSEHESGLDFQIGEFIRRNFRDRRLFWTPDHPTLALYTYVQKQIAQRLGIWINAFARHEEPHSDALIILPGVKRSLALKFDGDVYRLEGAPGGAASLEQFLALTLQLSGKDRAQAAG
ncbi:MAG: hypothetical protein EON48_17680 [Acetobacteraceae bacterium]|nr:MAG: hypothetical protein EON48_17680 [Acetobacteraceae bacterium]